jgi:hypothetical protein
MKILRGVCFFMLAAAILSCATLAQESERSAKILSLEGAVEVRLGSQKAWIPAEIGMVLGEGDVIKTRYDSYAVLNLDGSGETATVDITENSQLLLSELIKDESDDTETTLLDLAIGKILIKAQKLDTPESRFEVKTPTSVVGVRGTAFSVEVEAVE